MGRTFVLFLGRPPWAGKREAEIRLAIFLKRLQMFERIDDVASALLQQVSFIFKTGSEILFHSELGGRTITRIPDLTKRKMVSLFGSQ
jgi:hypothetical protein